DKVMRVPVPIGKDAWVAAKAEGDASMWPVVTPLEVPPLLVADAINAIGGALGVQSPLGNLVPTQRTIVKPFALTNPVLIDGDGDGRFGKPRPRGAVIDPSSGASVRDARSAGADSALLDLRRELRRW